MMFKQSQSRSLRAPGRGYKVKHVSQICLTLAVSLWMMYQLRHCYFNKASINERTGLVRIGRREDKAGSHKVAATLGRKELLRGLVVDADEDAKITDEAGRWDEFEQLDDLMEETDEQEADTDDTEQENQSDDDLVENLTKRNRTDIVRD